MKLAYTLFYVNDVEKTMNFYAAAFGLERGFLAPGHQYGEMVTGATKLGFVHHDTAGSHGFTYEKMDATKSAPAVEVGFVSDNVKADFDKAVHAGATPVTQPTIKPWGQTVSYVRDCNGFLVEICSAM